jgi:diacylglycerol kinase (ATP)
MSALPKLPDPAVNPQKARKGFERVFPRHADFPARPARRLERARLPPGSHPVDRHDPGAFWLGRSWVEVALLAGSAILVMIVELLNTAVEAAIDRIGPEWHDLSKRAKDMGSAAVLLSLTLCGGIWAAALWQRFVS